MKEGWVIKKLSDICSINYGTRVVQKKDGGSIYPVYGGGGATFRMDRYNREDCLIISRFAMSPQCVRYVQGKFFLNDSGLTIESNNPDLIQSFLDKQIISLNDKIYSLGKGAAQKNLDIKELKLLNICIPPSLAEQKRIVAELDCLSSVIEKQKELLKELDNLAQSTFYTMFGDPITNEKGWEVKKLGEICYSELGKMLDTKKNTGTLHPYLCALNVQWGTFNLDIIKEMKIEEEDLERYEVKKGDLLICEGGDTGRCAIWNNDDIIYYQNSLHRVRFAKEYMLPIVCQYIMLHYKKQGEIDKYSTGQTIKHLVKKSLLTIPFPIAPLSLQQEFASKIEAIEKQKELIKQSIAETEMLFNSRMDYYFN